MPVPSFALFERLYRFFAPRRKLLFAATALVVAMIEGGLRPGEGLMLRSPLQGRESDTRKVIRGGSFGGPEAMAKDNARTTRRLWSNPGYWHPDVGFRCVKPGR